MTDQRRSLLSRVIMSAKEHVLMGNAFNRVYEYLWKPTLLLLVPQIVTNTLEPGDHAGKLPTMGWNSWKVGSGPDSHAKVMEMAYALKDKGLQAAGYTLLSMDDGWQLKERNATCHLVADPARYPTGVQGLANDVHGLNFTLGIYSTGTHTTCGNNPGSLDREAVDAQDFAAWGVDYLKYDNCNINAKIMDKCNITVLRKNWTDEFPYCVPDRVKKGTPVVNGSCPSYPTPTPTPYDWYNSNTAERYKRMHRELFKQSPPILFAMCIWGEADVFSWGHKIGISWRVSKDMLAEWSRLTDIVNIMSFRTRSTNFWGRNDADTMRFGEGLTDAEERTQFTMWAAMKSPLIIGGNITSLTDAQVALLSNRYLLAFNQDDSVGESATPYQWGHNPDYTFDRNWPAEYWAGASSNGTLIVMMNTEKTAVNKTAVWKDIPGLSSENSYRPINVFDDQKDLGCLRDEYTVEVESHDTAAIIVHQCRDEAGGQGQ